jgi:hypothetical protein
MEDSEVLLMMVTLLSAGLDSGTLGGIESYSGTTYSRVYVVFIGAEAAGLLTTYGTDFNEYQHRALSTFRFH